MFLPLKNRREMASPSAYRGRFGGLRRAYELIAYGRPDQFGPFELRRRTTALREQLLARIAGMFPGKVSVVRRGGRWRSRLRVGRVTVSALVVRSARVWGETRRWMVEPIRNERKCVTLVARLNEANDSFLDFHLFPAIGRRGRFRLSLDHPWLKEAMRLDDVGRFCEAVALIGRSRERSEKKRPSRSLS